MKSQTLFTPEQELLLCCARTRFSDLYSNRVEQLVKNGLDWETVIELAETHKLTQLLYKNLGSHCPDSLPVERLQQLQKIYNTKVQYILFLTGELVSLVKEFNSREIPILPY